MAEPAQPVVVRVSGAVVHARYPEALCVPR